MNLNPFKKSPAPQTEPPAPALVSPLVAAEQELDAATAECLQLDEERRAWATRREVANRRFAYALTGYHAALDKAEKTA
jgi:hypothetical protein